MIKPAKKRKGDAIQVAHSVMQDVIALSNKPVIAPPIKKPKRSGNLPAFLTGRIRASLDGYARPVFVVPGDH
jgi:hypothetical protein